jgi:hypothetical protein
MVQMEPDRFDDVEFRITEAPEPPPRRGRWVLAGVASLLATGMLAAGASALTSGGGEPAKPAAAKPPPTVRYTADGVPFVRSGRGCMAGHGKRHDRRGSAVKY